MTRTIALPRARPEIDALPAYSKASGAATVRWRASSNESTIAPSPAVVEAIARAGEHGHLYPTLFADDLVAALAERLSVPADAVLTGAGSLALLQQVLTAYTGPGTEVVHAWRSYEAYPILIGIAGATAVPVPLDAQHRHDVDAMIAAVTPRTRAVLVCNPNNPTGTELTEAEVRRLLDGVPSHVLVILDEAYREFAEEQVDGVELLREYPNVVVLRTFSKAYGLAGLRVGYAIADSAVAAPLHAAAPPFGLSSVAEAAACAALTDAGHTDRIVESVRDGRRHLRSGLADRGIRTPTSGGNFVWIPIGDRAAELEAACVAHGVSVRAFATEGVRVTVGDRDAEDAVLAAVDHFTAQPAG
ncbi:histidinol-phosphate transaminase [Prescottella equi]|uniref:Histidinol-phosphate aminotransferase n=1 Tax=Rhodococcus hoagii TaxID=43767 RepID=A0AAE5ISA0_RHOHA|nr:histidinol-phosphate transaminase [Prescottella equi]MBM4628169.1 aminotransferase class I/II-fold pyridoxal phosphate-dependent enzyme [Prescottella equi]NKZ80096.1 aminotransferase class I/II-fold pyridoxal phosphate-dependent enzyme [Prescottella equi]ORL26307.1 aminotransferase [Prescottella equi]ORM03307.1 aminotransferase [Prescottella equi]ORM28361.1 aminotransferase [Prescottella equi]